MKYRITDILVWSLAVVSILIMIAGIGLSVQYVITSGDYRRFVSHQSLVPISTIIYAVIGALVTARHPKNPIGWIFGAVGLLYGLNALSVGYSLTGPAIGVEVAGWLNTWVWIPTILLPTTFVFLLFPDGRLLSSRWRIAAWPAALGLIASVIGIALHPGPVESWGIERPNPFGIAAVANLLDDVVNVGSVLLTVGLVGSIGTLIVRFRRSRDLEREQMKWLAYAAGLMVVGFILGSIMWVIWPDDPTVTELAMALTSVVILGIAVAASVAILRYRLYDINLIINRTLVYGTLTMLVVGLYVLVVGTLGTLFQTSGNFLISVIATGSVAMAFQPLRERLQRTINRLMYGARDDPVAVLSSLGQRIEATIAPDAVLPGIVETVAQALKLPYVAIELEENRGHQASATYGVFVDEAARLPLVYQGEKMGNLVVAARSPGESFNQTDMRLLENIAHLASAVVHAVQLNAALQRSRRRLVTTREEERRRIRRDLHDGLGPVLASLAMQSDAARSLVRLDPDEAEALLADIVDQAQAAIIDIRRLVYNLRPPSLDEMGLMAALRTYAANNQNGLQIKIDAPHTLPVLPAAVEVAVYRIVQEAITNVVRHAKARMCIVQLACDDGVFSLTVYDDGRGLSPVREAGIGSRSMRERAEELGGVCTIEPLPSGGTCVQARLPLN